MSKLREATAEEAAGYDDFLKKWQQGHVINSDSLKKFFPSHAEEIDQYSGKMPCGCAFCVWAALKYKHPELKLPESRKNDILC